MMWLVVTSRPQKESELSLDFEHYRRLHAIALLEELLHRWWSLTLQFHPSSDTLPTQGPDTFFSAPVTDGESPLGSLCVRVPETAKLSTSELSKLRDLLDLGARHLANALALSRPSPHAQGLGDLLGQSSPMLGIFRLIEKVAPSDSTILVQGESGTGKELVARAIHQRGTRANRPFVVQNCSALNDNLLESTLFGHLKGAFTGAVKDQKGLLEMADGGTFFLDEVGDMSPALQTKLLRVLQEGTFSPVGGSTIRKVDVRMIAATHKDLGELVKAGQFREDLYYRIHVIRLFIPPLRERKEDIPVLVRHFLQKHRPEGSRIQDVAPETLELLISHAWPGNVRELQNEMERLIALGSEYELLPPELLSPALRGTHPAHGMADAEAATPMDLNLAIEQLERRMISESLARTQGNKSQVARELGVSRSNLILKIQKYGLDSPSGE